MKKILTTLIALVLALQAQAQYDYPTYHFKGTLNGKIAVEMAFQVGNHAITAGYIYYPKAKNPAPILLVGTYQNDEPYNDVYLREFQSDGTVSGRMHLRFSEVEGDFEFVEGSWTNPKTGKEMPFRLRSVFNPVLPAWYGPSPLTPENPANIGREYSYTFWNENYKALMGGNITFRAAGKNKLHFAASNCPQNIAEGESKPGRPAVLKGNEFEYTEMNECHYGFRASFFPRFVVLETIQGGDQMHQCFGLGASLDGVYIKQVQ